jgi:hypothetical protein
MRCLFLLLLAVVIGCCSGCDELDRAHNASAREAHKNNAKALAEGGAVVGKLPDGRVLKVIQIDTGGPRDHYVYIVDGVRSVTTNRSESSGKTDVVRTEAFIGE